MTRLAAAAAVAVALAGMPAPAFAGEQPPSPPVDITAGGVMQVVAHEDDDLFFMNPDISRSISAGLPSTTVYLTAGEISGNGELPEDKARNRQRGVQNAYAFMAGVADSDDTTQDEWVGDVLQVGDRQLERYRLRMLPRVQLLFANIQDFTVWSIDEGNEGQTVVPTDGLVTTSMTYTRADAVLLLRKLLDTYQPVLLRAQDPEPTPTILPEPVLEPSSDHPDHTSGARFAREAAAGYPGPLYEVNYRDYDVAGVPANLGRADILRKTAIVEQYYRYDQGYQSGGRGDQWLERQYYRWSRGTNWATCDENGLLEVYEVRNGLVQRYRQTAIGGWNGPTRLADPGGRVAPGLAIGHDADGRLEVFAHRLTDHHLISLRQNTLTGAFPNLWTDLGSPSLGSGYEDQVGTPAVASDNTGRLEVFVKNAEGGVSALVQTAPGGAWSSDAWVSLPGGGGENDIRDVQDGLSVITTSGGQIELFATTKTKILRWREDKVEGVYYLDAAFPAFRAASPPHAIVDKSGKIQVAFLNPDPQGLSLSLIRQLEPSKDSWLADPVNLGNPGDPGEPAMALSSMGLNDRVMLFARNWNSGVSASIQGGQGMVYGPWDDLGGVTFDQPAAATDGHGRAAVFTIGRFGVSVGTITVAGTMPSVGGWQRLAPD